MLSRPARARFAAAIRRLLRPVIRQLIAYGISYPAFNRIVKQLYVEVAERDFALPFKRQTDSRLALVTGISRKEIPALRRQRRSQAEAVEVEETVVTHVIGRWLAAPPYIDADGVPRRLPYEAEEPSPSFARLVRELGVDIPVRAVLDELLRIGSVALEPSGAVALRREAHVPIAGAEGKLTLLGSDPAELFTTIVHNIEHEDTWLQRKVVYDNIGSDALVELRREAGTVGEDLLRRANQLLSSYDRDRSPAAPGGRRSRVVVGVYYYEEEMTTSPPKDGAEPSPAPPGRIRRSQ